MKYTQSTRGRRSCVAKINSMYNCVKPLWKMKLLINQPQITAKTRRKTNNKTRKSMKEWKGKEKLWQTQRTKDFYCLSEKKKKLNILAMNETRSEQTDLMKIFANFLRRNPRTHTKRRKYKRKKRNECNLY